MRQMTGNPDYVAALLHGRRSRMAEGGRLEALCRLRTVAEFAGEALGATRALSAAEVQRRLIQALAEEAEELAAHLTKAAVGLVHWLTARFQVEDLKVLLRGLLTGATAEEMESHLISVPSDLRLSLEALAKAESLDAFARLLPKGPLRRCLMNAIDLHREQPRAFFLEAALDHGYFDELLARANAFPGGEGELARPMILQETDIFHLMLVTRGRFIYGLEPDSLLPLHLRGTRVSRDEFEGMLREKDVRIVAVRAAGRVIDPLEPASGERSESSETSDPAGLERLAWSRFWRLANRAFRRSHMGPATVVAYLQLRRVEVANLITICEGIRAAVSPETLRARLVPLVEREVSHV